jgi:D-alanine-D-alanine ligase
MSGPLEGLREAGLRVAVLCGGSGSERAVSLVSGEAVAAAVARLGVPCDCIDLADDRLPDSLDPATHVVLPIIHGGYGEDGRLSAELAAAGFAYAGCDQAASVLCFDKLATKAIAARVGVPVVGEQLLRPGEAPAHAELAQRLGTPFILKPRRDGSSVGLHRVACEADFARAQPDLAATEYLAETYLPGHDLTVGLLDGRPLGVVAIHPEGGLYDYRHKYTSGLSRYEAPADLPAPLTGQLRDWSRRLHNACGCRDLARVDFRMGRGGEVGFLEINTLPGMTPTSLLPKSAACCGMDFDSLVSAWLALAVARLRPREGDR